MLFFFYIFLNFKFYLPQFFLYIVYIQNDGLVAEFKYKRQCRESVVYVFFCIKMIRVHYFFDDKVGLLFCHRLYRISFFFERECIFLCRFFSYLRVYAFRVSRLGQGYYQPKQSTTR